jgi:hypothetical protein
VEAIVATFYSIIGASSQMVRGELIKVENAITVLWKSNLGCPAALTVVRRLPAIAEPGQEAKTLKLIDCDLVCIEQDISSSLQHEPGLHGF